MEYLKDDHSMNLCQQPCSPFECGRDRASYVSTLDSIQTRCMYVHICIHVFLFVYHDTHGDPYNPNLQLRTPPIGLAPPMVFQIGVKYLPQ